MSCEKPDPARCKYEPLETKLSLGLYDAVTTNAANWAHCSTCEKTSFVAYNIAYVSNIGATKQVGNGYW